MENKIATDYLKLFRISDRRYLIGIFQEGITVYKQQVRSLNILYALFSSGKIKVNDKVVVIGGGVAGLTIASAALQLGLKVSLFEQKNIYMHVQYGCDTRKIHPNIYDWPDKESFFPYADLPVLSWKYNTASRVTRQILDGFHRIVQSKKGNMKEIKNCTIKSISEKNGKVEIDWLNEENESEKFDFAIYATGYGIEEGVETEKHTPSYWRNDDYAQLRLIKRNQPYYISGTGDGGLIDLFRLKIFEFSIDSVIKDLSRQLSYSALILKFNEIKEDWQKIEDTPPENWLYDEFNKIDSAGMLKDFKDILKTKLRNENILTLNGNEQTFKGILNLNKISFLNALIAYCLYKIDGFNYKSGACELKNKEYLIDGEKIQSIVIIRHGTPREKFLSDLFLTPAEISSLKVRQKNNYSYNLVKRLWPSGWWSTNFIQNINKDYKPFIEFFTPDTQSLSTTFVSVLSKVLEHFHLKFSDKKREFRVTLHRMINIQDEDYFQQITAYFGSKENIIGEVGRIFSLQGGAVGYSARTGKTIIMERKAANQFELLTRQLELDEISARSLDDDVNSLLTMPILATNDNGKLATNLILYIDSNESDFFEKDDDILPLISKSALGFIESISALLKANQISMSPITFKPKEIIGEPKLQKKLMQNKCFKDVSSKYPSLSPEKTELKFDTFHSFNIIFNHEHDSF